jgi:glycine cleavage system H protein
MYYTQTHEWIRAESNGIATMGVTHQAQSQVGEIVHIELPRIGAQLRAGDAIAVMESTKAAIDIYTPVSGTITAINEHLRTNPSLINSSPEDQGWLIQIALSNPAELQSLLPPDAYADALNQANAYTT